MSGYEFHLIGGDGSRLRQERYSLSDTRTAWEHIFTMTKSCNAPGAQVQVLDDRGDVIIRVGVATAAALARMRERAIMLDPAV